MEELNKYILAKAIENNICEPWAEKISSCGSIDEFLQMYVAGIDFCLSNNFPSNTDLQRLAGDYINQYGIYIDQQFKLSDRPVLVSLGSCLGDIVCNGFSTTQVFVKGQSSISVIANDNAFAVIDCFDDSVTHVEVNGNAKALVNVYKGARVTTASTGKGIVKVINKLKETY